MDIMKERQKGFTLIELIVVISIIGIVSAIAIPKYINLVQDAKYGKLLGAKGALASSASTLNALYLASGGDKSRRNDSFTLSNGSRVRMRFGYPNRRDIVQYVQLTDYIITGRANRVDVRIKARDRTYLRYVPRRAGLYLEIRGRKENL